jgi:diaminohydroxyphosphoribosylaminopyrimidine deaminase/5-amino-6-(5-phosphoribosylamino)uracil reductase
MKLALSLASLGRGFTTPNPLVGAVVVKDGRIVGVGYHKGKGLPHAEALAIEDAGDHAQGGTLYVTLEPHHFYGSVPPCTEKILEAGIKRVVVAVEDPNPKVRGKGIRVLMERGVEVEVGLMEEEARDLNAPYFKVMEEGRAFITLKLALTLDGFIADQEWRSRWISSEESRYWVHKLRGEVDGVLVGMGTILKDNPRLTPRLVSPSRVPYRIVFDPMLDIDERALVLRDPMMTIIVTTERGEKADKKGKLEALGCRVWVHGGEQIDIRGFLMRCAKEGIHHILVEGGSGVASQFLEAGELDRLVLFYAPKILGQGLSPFRKLRPLKVREALRFKLREFARTGEDLRVILEPIKDRGGR